MITQNGFRKFVFALLRFALPALIIGYLLWRIDVDDWQLIEKQQKHWGLIAGASGLSLFATVLSFIRWWLLVHALSISLSMVEAIKLGAIGHFLSYVSAGSIGGDLFKGVFLAHRSPGKRIESVASIGVDRVIGLTGLLIVVTTALICFPPSSLDPVMVTVRHVTFVVTPLILLGLCGLVFGGRLVDRALLLVRRIPKIGRGLFRLAEFVRFFDHHRGVVFIAIAMSVTIHCMLVLAVDLIARGLFESPPTLVEHLVIVPCGLTAGALPITPAGLGVFEAALDHLYRVVPSVPTTASGTLVALIYDMIRLLIAVIGVVFFWTAGRELRTSGLHFTEPK